MKNFLSRFVILSLLFWSVPEFSFTHDELSEQVQLVSEKIKTNPRDASLYFERAELYRGDQHWSLAEKDYFQARKLSPELAAVQLGLGMLYYNTKRYEDSIQALDRFLLKHPDHSEGLITRGRDQKMLGNFSAAIDDYSSALQLRPDPAIYIERSRLLVSQKKTEEAIRGLDDGISKLGPVVTMELYAVELDLTLKRFDSALARIDEVAKQSERKESWFVRRAEILHLAGRDTEAVEYYRKAQQAIDELPDTRKGTRYTLDLRQKIEAALVMLSSDPLQ